MRVIGLTGNIASGKSTVARVWRSLGAVVIDADRIGHAVLAPGSETLERLIEAFGEEILSDGRLDRNRVAAIVFGDEKALERLNALVHPVIGEKIRERIKAERRRKTPVVVVDAALIFEAGIEDAFDLVVVVDAPLERRILWLREGRGLGREEALRIEGAQLDPGEKAGRGDFVLENTGTVEALEKAAKSLYAKILKDRRGREKRC